MYLWRELLEYVGHVSGFREDVSASLVGCATSVNSSGAADWWLGQRGNTNSAAVEAQTESKGKVRRRKKTVCFGLHVSFRQWKPQAGTFANSAKHPLIIEYSFYQNAGKGLQRRSTVGCAQVCVCVCVSVLKPALTMLDLREPQDGFHLWRASFPAFGEAQATPSRRLCISARGGNSPKISPSCNGQ